MNGTILPPVLAVAAVTASHLFCVRLLGRGHVGCHRTSRQSRQETAEFWQPREEVRWLRHTSRSQKGEAR
ncbi:hypothetical protein [Streptomyces mayteni]